MTRILYVVPELRSDAGATVNVVFPEPLVGAAAIGMHFTKLLLETWSVPLHTVFVVLTVMVEGLAALLKITAIEVLAGTPVAPSAGVVDTTTNGIGVGVIVGVLVGDFFGVLVGVGVMVGVFVGVAVGGFVGVFVTVLVGVCVGVTVGVYVGVFVGV